MPSANSAAGKYAIRRDVRGARQLMRWFPSCQERETSTVYNPTGRRKAHALLPLDGFGRSGQQHFSAGLSLRPDERVMIIPHSGNGSHQALISPTVPMAWTSTTR